jgi:hypothetical protein
MEYSKQYLLKIEEKSIDGTHPIEIAIPDHIDLTRCSILLIKNDRLTPIRLIYAQTFWIIHEGHDYSIKDRIFKTHSDIFKNNKSLLFCYGKKIPLKCSQNHRIHNEEQHFCTECGEELDWNEILKVIKIT